MAVKSDMKPVFLIGYMGCGKTTLGTALAKELKMPYIDLDECIEQASGMTIPQIFDEMGEAHFRQIEAATLRNVAAMTDTIVGCGGGTPCHCDNMTFMNQAGTTVWLTTSPKVLAARLLLPDQKHKRPKISALPDEAVLPFVVRELQERTPFYAQAQVHFDATDIDTMAATSRTARQLADILKR